MGRLSFVELLDFFKKNRTPHSLASFYFILVELGGSAESDVVRKMMKLSIKQFSSLMSILIELNVIECTSGRCQALDISHSSLQIVVQEISPVKAIIFSEAHSIIMDLNKRCGKNFSVNDGTMTKIKKLLDLGFSFEDFAAVNLYFSMEWNTPSMESYIDPSTLYNGKFAERLDKAKNSLSGLANNRDAIMEFQEAFNTYYTKYVNSDGYTLTQADIKSINFWLSKYDLATIISVCNTIVEKWSTQGDLTQYLVPYVIMSEKKFPSRVSGLSAEKNVNNSRSDYLKELASS